MNIACLRTFLSVVQTGNLNKAAEQLHVTQSTVTTRLDTLEDSLGQRLLMRSRRGAELTKAGFAFRRHAELIVTNWEIGRKKVHLPKGFSGHFSLACHHDLWEAKGNIMIDRISDEYPGLAMEIWPGSMDEIRRWASSGMIDAGLVPHPLTDTGLSSSGPVRERLVQVSSVDRGVQDWDPDYIFVDYGPEYQRSHASIWPNDETARFSFASARWALDHLLCYGGSAYLPWSIARPHVEAGRLFVIANSTELERSLYLIWRDAAVSAHIWLPEASAYLADTD
jgi:DNA-binding transcriptional LysR family regulator